jgi:hypothetical protein
VTDLWIVLDAWLPGGHALFYLGLSGLGIVALVESLARRRWGVVLGVPITTLHEDYDCTIDDPRAVDLSPHLYEVARVKWLSRVRLLLMPLRGEVDMQARGSGSGAFTGGGFMCVGDLHVDARPGTTHFRTRVLLRVVPLAAALLFLVGCYVPMPWGMGWSLPGRHPSLLWSLGPLVLFGGFFGVIAARARTGVIAAHHAVTGAFMTAIRGKPASNPAGEPDPTP